MASSAMTVSPGFLLLTAFVNFLGGGGAVTAFFSAALAHELGHLIAMWAIGGEVSSVRLSFCGPVIEYWGDLSVRQEMCLLAAGPLGGMLFSILCIHLGTEYFAYAGAIGLLSTFFNLLPVIPMDGGRLLLLLLEGCMPARSAAVILRLCGNLCGAGIVLLGIWIGAPVMAAMGIWMAALANRPELR